MRATDIGGGSGKYAGGKVKETTIVNGIVKALSQREGSYTRKFHGGHFQRSGIPDVYHVEYGVSFWLEVKRPGGDTTALQKHNLELLDAAGCVVGVVSSVTEAVSLVEGVINDVVKEIGLIKGTTAQTGK